MKLNPTALVVTVLIIAALGVGFFFLIRAFDRGSDRVEGAVDSGELGEGIGRDVAERFVDGLIGLFGDAAS